MRKSTTIRKAEMVSLVERLLMDGGIKNVTIKTIASASGFSEAAVYRHFKNKQAMLQAVADDLEQRLFQAFDDASSGVENPMERLARIMETHLQFTERRRGGLFLVISACILADDSALKKRMFSLVERYLDRIGNLLQQSMERKLIRMDVDIRECSLFFFGMIQNAAIYFALSEYKSTPASHNNAFFDTFFRGLVVR